MGAGPCDAEEVRRPQDLTVTFGLLHEPVPAGGLIHRRTSIVPDDTSPDSLPYAVPIDGFTTFTTAAGEGKFVFVSGITARDADGTIRAEGDVGGQARQILQTLKHVLASAGGTLENVKQIRSYVLDIDNAWPSIEPVWRE